MDRVSKIIYLDPWRGSDKNDGGSMINPVQTWTKALDLCCDGKTNYNIMVNRDNDKKAIKAKSKRRKP